MHFQNLDQIIIDNENQAQLCVFFLTIPYAATKRHLKSLVDAI